MLVEEDGPLTDLNLPPSNDDRKSFEVNWFNGWILMTDT